MKIFMGQRQSGQILLVVLLIMIVGLTIGLFLLSRTTTDISLTTKVSDSSRAFNAAEAGIEDAIRSTGTVGATPVPVKITSDATYTVGATALGATGLYPADRQKPVELGQAFTVWLVGHNEVDGSFDFNTKYLASYDTASAIYICFTTNATPPSLGVTMIYRDSLGVIRSSYAGYDSPGRSPVTARFETAVTNSGVCPTGTTGYDYYASVLFTTHYSSSELLGITPIALRIRPLYAPSSIAVQAVGGTLPKQGNDIISTGNVGEVTRRINVKKPYTVPPPFLDYVLYSTGNTNLSHN